MRLFQIQIIDGKDLQSIGIDQGQYKKKLDPVRGNIYDRKNRPLTRNITHYSFAVRPSEISNKAKFCAKISHYLNSDQSKYLNKMSTKSHYVYLERNLLREQCENLLLNLPNGLIVERKSYRHYPHENLASQILGYVNVDNQGLAGIETKFNEFLEGTPGWIVRQMNGKGRSKLNSNLPFKSPVDGANIQLTIDVDYQAVLQEELAGQINHTGASSGMGIILNPQTGDILAMASVPDFNPNSPGKSKIELHKNRVISDQFEPGSTFKIVPVMAAVDRNTVPLNREFNCENGSYVFAGRIIKDWDKFGILNMPQIFENSSNVGVIKIAETLTPNILYGYGRDFGFGMHTFISLDGENAGTLRQVSEWSEISMAEYSLGHEVGVTVLQLGMAYSAIANGGVLMKPRLVKQIVSTTGDILYTEQPEVIRKVASQKVMDIMTDMMCRVVNTGTGTRAAIQGWKVAGKTGTAQKFVNGEYSDKKFISNFAGFLPAEDPQLAGVIVLDEPKIGYHWGGQGAAPVFQKVMERIINMDDSIHPVKAQPKNDQLLAQERPLPHTQDKFLADPVALSSKFNVKNAVYKQYDSVPLPDLKGLSLKRAKTLLTEMGLKTNFEGSGKVVWQNPKAGTIMSSGSICTIGLK